MITQTDAGPVADKMIDQIKVGDKVIFRNGEICTIQQIKTDTGGYEVCNTNFRTVTVASFETIILEFDDGEITIAARNEFEVI